jgi:hypothetical protein
MIPSKLTLSLALAVSLAGCASTTDPPRQGTGGSGSTTSTSSSATGGGGAGPSAATTSVASSTSSGSGSSGAGGAGGSGGSSGIGGAGGVAGSSGAGGGAGSAGAPDAGARDAASDAQQEGGSAVCAPDVLCFDFENYAAGAKPGAPWMGQGTVDATKSVSGKNSLHVVSGGDNAFASMKGTFFPPAGNEYYGRVMFWVDNVPNSHWTFVRSKGAVPGQSYSAEYTYGGSGKTFIANYDTQGVSSDCWKDGGPLAVGKWVCMEWHFKGATNELELWIDGTADKAHVVGKGDGCIAHGTNDVWNAPTFGSLELGFATYPTATTYNVWFDDVALAKARVGCPR